MKNEVNNKNEKQLGIGKEIRTELRIKLKKHVVNWEPDELLNLVRRTSATVRSMDPESQGEGSIPARIRREIV